jgi:hypothetical protein
MGLAEKIRRQEGPLGEIHCIGGYAMDIRTQKKIERWLKGDSDKTFNVIGFLDLFLLVMIFIPLSLSTVVEYKYVFAFLQLSMIFMWFQIISMWIRMRVRIVRR